MSTVIQKYGVGVFSFLIAVLTAVQVMNHWGLADILQLCVIIITSFTAFMLPLVNKAWRGGLKTGADILGAIIILVIPYVVTGHITGPQIVMVAIGAIKALATEFGVQIRTDPVVLASSAGAVNDPASVKGRPLGE